MRSILLAALVACGSPKSPVVATPSPSPAPPPDAAVDAFVDTELLAAPPTVFRFTAPDRKETWTLRHVGGRAQIVVEAKGTTIYTGTAVETGGSLKIEVATQTAKLSLDCKQDKLAVLTSAACDARKSRNVDVLSCKVPGFDAPMPFGGIEYVQGCGYRSL